MKMIIAIVQNILLVLMLIAGVKELKPMLKWAFGKERKRRKKKMKKRNITVRSNENLKENLKQLENMGYKYIVKTKDKFLSGWGKSGVNGHIQLIAVKNLSDAEATIKNLEQNDDFNYIDYQPINNYKSIKNYTRNKSFTIRNDWIIKK